MNSFRIACIVFFLFLLKQNSIFAQVSDIVTDRPDQTESALTIQKGYYQLETGSFIENFDANNQFGLNTSLHRYGITNKFELRLVHTLLSADFTGNGESLAFEDIQLGFKYNFLDGPLELGYIGHLSLPTGSEDKGFGSTAYSSTISIAHSITENIPIGYNFGIDFMEDGQMNYRYTVAVGLPITEKIGMFLESYGEGEEEFNHLVDAGFTLLSKPNVQYDLSFGTSLSESYSFLSFGLSLRLPN